MSLAKVCQTPVRAVPDFKFAAYSLEDEEVWHIPCAQEGFKVHYAPMDIKRSFVRFIKGEVTRLNPMAFDESKVRPFIIGRLRLQMPLPRSSCGLTVGGGGKSSEIIVHLQIMLTYKGSRTC